MCVIWSAAAESKMIRYQSEHFTREETLDYIAGLMMEIEKQLLNPFISIDHPSHRTVLIPIIKRLFTSILSPLHHTAAYV
ncbi:hypothetical protein SAMN05216238_101344 [Lentibacillus persicus]|uniref:Uncharacterized protein n=1 Tax=Lentibacillus persicus TaxID=640948 RepID=A0A1I1SLN9_9BACI|nr:hypothetical protein SAMN05216238_101344 [Lentibacillus persicus]